MKTALALRHIHFENLGTLEPLLRERGYDVTYVDPATDDLAALDARAPDLVVALGGPIGVYDTDKYPFLSKELAFVENRLAAQRPLLGICLGAQMIARVSGAAVYAMGVKEIGFQPLTLTEAGRASALAAVGDTPVLHWHGDQFDIPADATRLASTMVCANQAFAMGPRVLALQCHLETDVRLLERWLVGHAAELNQAGVDPRSLRGRARELSARLSASAREVFAAWLDDAQTATATTVA